MANNSDFPAGTYVLNVDQYTEREYTDDRLKEVRSTTEYEKGDEIELDEANALRLGNSGAVVKKDTVEARVAKGEIDPAVAPPPGASVDQLEAQKEAIEQALKDRRESDKEADEARNEVRANDGPTTDPVPGAAAEQKSAKGASQSGSKKSS